MPIAQINWNPETRQLKQFGWLALILLPLVAWFWGATMVWIAICVGIGGLLAAMGFVAPRFLRPVFVGLSLLFLPIGLIVGELLLVAIFLLLFLPIGLVFRMIGRDRLQRRMNRSEKTYWQRKETPGKIERYFRQY